MAAAIRCALLFAGIFGRVYHCRRRGRAATTADFARTIAAHAPGVSAARSVGCATVPRPATVTVRTAVQRAQTASASRRHAGRSTR